MKQHNEPGHLNGLARTHETRTVLAAALALALATVSVSAQASTHLVTNCTDHDPGSMRAAMTAAMSGDVVDATGLTCSTITLSTGALVVTANTLTVKGPGPDRLTVTNGAAFGRVLRHEGNVELDLRGMTINSGVVSTNGVESGTKGGCIYSKGAVALGNKFDPTDAANGVVVSDCDAISSDANFPAEGGGIFAQNGVGLSHSMVTHSRAVSQDQAYQARGGGIAVAGGSFLMKNSEVSDCEATGPGASSGGIYAFRVVSVTVTHSTIAGNSATGDAGGAYLGSFGSPSGGLVQIDNSTISGNTAAIDAGVRVNVGNGLTAAAIKIYSSTITGNHASSVNSYAGGADLIGPANIDSTIAAGNFNAGIQNNLSLNSGTTGANNLVGSVSDTPSQSNWIVAADPKLGPLSNRGGFTRTHLPLPNSPAVNAGNNVFGSTTDQRGPGFPRVIGSAPDIGAAEYDPDRIFNNGFD